MHHLAVCCAVALFATLGSWLPAFGAKPQPQRASGDTPTSIPYVATRTDIVRDMLYMAGTGKDDVVYDPGSGDGRILIAAVRDFGARRAVGIEIDPKLADESRRNVQAAGIADRVEIIQGDLFTDLFKTDFSQATIVTLFLGHKPNLTLRPILFSSLKPGARIVTNQFSMGEWEPDKILKTRLRILGMYGTMAMPFMDNRRVPDYTGYEISPATGAGVNMWVIPARVAGVWRGSVETSAGLQPFKLTLHQRLSEASGEFEVDGPSKLAGAVGVDLWADHVRFAGSPPRAPFMDMFRFDGHVSGDTMKGAMAVHDAETPREGPFELKRDKVNFTGTWEWPNGDHAARLDIRKRNGSYEVAYIKGDKRTPVSDFYDFGGGFYFTVLLGSEGQSYTSETRWVVGEAIADLDGKLKGAIEYHAPDTKNSTGYQEWAPYLVER